MSFAELFIYVWFIDGFIEMFIETKDQMWMINQVTVPVERQKLCLSKLIPGVPCDISKQINQ